jgi:predicted  nucleic acid-binding Zn-ribbon protein
MLGLSANPAGALPAVEADPTPGLLLVQGEPPQSEQRPQEDRQAPFADLEKVLEATRAKLEELTGATATAAANTELRKELQALERDNERLAAQLKQAKARSTELARSNEFAEARIAGLTKAVEEATRKAARVEEALAGQIRRNQQLDESRARAEAAREAAVAEAEKTGAETAAKLEAATDAAKRSSGELADLREELNEARQELATAKSAGEDVGTRVSELEEVVERSIADAERLKTELAAVKEQLGQAAGAAVEAERARQTASNEAESLRREAARSRDQLTAVNTEIDRYKTTNAELEKEVAAWRTSSTSAIETARQNLIMMEKKIEELNAALAVAPPEEGTPAGSPPTKPAPPEKATPAVSAPTKPVAPGDEPSAATQAPSTAQPRAPEPASKTDAGQPAGSPVELSETQLSMVGPTTAPTKADPRLAGFRAKIQALNDLELSTEGLDLFSGVASVKGRTVHVGATAAWDALPAVGKQSYLDSLLDYWVAAQGGQGPAVVRIVDPGGRVLVEKAWP